MQTVGIHIEYLLRKHECVILPGVGAFLRTYTPAEYRDSDGALLPPQVKVCFNSSIVKSDGLLSHSVALRNRIDFEQASVMVSEAGERCRRALEKDSEVAIGKLGTLLMDAEKCVSFRPYSRPFDFAFKPQLPSRSDEELKDDAKVVASAADTSKYYIIRVSRRAVRYVAMVAVMLLTATTLMLPSASRNAGMVSPRQYASVVPGVERFALPRPEAKPAETIKEQKADAEQTGDELNKRFYLIVATFKKMEDCQKYISSQPDADSLYIASGSKVNRVYSAASDSREELQELMASETHRALHTQAWIWERPVNDAL